MRGVASAVFRTTASDTSARTRRKRSLPRSASVSCSVLLSVVRTVDRSARDVRLRSPCVARISAASDLRLADQNIMPIETQRENLKHQEESREFLRIVSDAFRIFARHSSMVLGSAWTFASAILIIVIWGLTGPMFHYSDTWQLIINTGTTIVTFLMVFLIQNTQNRDAKAAHLKLDELIRALKGARNELIDLEKFADEDLTSLEKQFELVRKKAELNGNDPGGKSRANRAERASKVKGI